ncbi:MAG: nucleoside deaminase [Deltaproteobacteria bacterium]|jgi:tRNA(adenine34) deaminase|nr:nucleoside deaminase [Deltaproteobacteria bacterium]
MNSITLELKNSLMKEALKEAQKAAQMGEVPAGALVSSFSGEIIARAHNSVITLSDPSAHAEILALREAGNIIQNYRLENLLLISTLEPCPMCLSCALLSRIKGIIYGAIEPKFGAHQSVLNLISVPVLNHHLEFIEGGILEDDCKMIVQEFFQARRKKII